MFNIALAKQCTHDNVVKDKQTIKKFKQLREAFLVGEIKTEYINKDYLIIMQQTASKQKYHPPLTLL